MRGPDPAARFLGELRDEARPALIKRMVMDRIENGGYVDGPTQSRLTSWAETLFLAVAAGVTTLWVAKKLKILRK